MGGAVLVRDPAGAPIGWYGVLIEITGMKKMGRPSLLPLPSAACDSRARRTLRQI